MINFLYIEMRGEKAFVLFVNEDFSHLGIMKRHKFITGKFGGVFY